MNPTDRTRWWWVVAGGFVAAATVTATVLLLRGDDETELVTVPLPPTTVPVPGGSAIQASTTLAVTTTAAAPTTAAPTTTGPADTTSPSTSAAPAAPTVGVLVAGPSGVQRIGTDGALTLTESAAAVAVERSGTVYVQGASGRYDDDGTPNAPADTAIQRVDGTVLIAPEGDQWLRLHDAGTTSDGVPILLYSVDGGDGPPTPDNPTPAIETLFRYEITTGASVRIADIGGWESGTGPLSFGTDIISGTWSAEASHGPLYLGLDGTTSDEASRYGLESSYADCSSCPEAFSVDAAGARVAWVDAGRFKVASRNDGAVLIDLPVIGDTFYTATALGEGFAVLSRFSLPPLLLDLTTGTLTELPAGYATLTR